MGTLNCTRTRTCSVDLPFWPYGLWCRLGVPSAGPDLPSHQHHSRHRKKPSTDDGHEDEDDQPPNGHEYDDGHPPDGQDNDDDYPPNGHDDDDDHWSSSLTNHPTTC